MARHPFVNVEAPTEFASQSGTEAAVQMARQNLNMVNAQPNSQGVATVNPIFTWVRLAQRILVRIHIDEAPPGVGLSAGMTATVEIDDRVSRAGQVKPGS